MNGEALRVLFVDPSQDGIDVIQKVLTPYNIAVEAVSNASSALRRLLDSSYAVVVFSAWHHRNNGIDACGDIARLREFAEKLPIIVLTGPDEDSKAYTMMKAGADTYVAGGAGSIERLKDTILDASKGWVHWRDHSDTTALRRLEESTSGGG